MNEYQLGLILKRILDRSDAFVTAKDRVVFMFSRIDDGCQITCQCGASLTSAAAHAQRQVCMKTPLSIKLALEACQRLALKPLMALHEEQQFKFVGFGRKCFEHHAHAHEHPVYTQVEVIGECC